MPGPRIAPSFASRQTGSYARYLPVNTSEEGEEEEEEVES